MVEFKSTESKEPMRLSLRDSSEAREKRGRPTGSGLAMRAAAAARAAGLAALTSASRGPSSQ